MKSKKYKLSAIVFYSVIIALALVPPYMALAGTVQLPKTGQTISYATGDDGDLEMGVAWPDTRFTDKVDGTVKDNLTGLVWSKNANLPGGTLTWQAALDYVAGMNAGTHPNFGYTDWRLPNVNELKSLIDNSKYNFALPQGHPFINVQSGWYRSSTTSADSTDVAWIVYMLNGFVISVNKSNGNYYYAWPVRSGQCGSFDNSVICLPKTGQTTSYATGDDGDLEMGVAWPDTRFTDNLDNTVKDNLTGLVWSKNANLPGVTTTWQGALDYVAGMNAGTHPNFGYTDWRLPNVNELKSLIDNSKYNFALPQGHPFTNVQSVYYWSSTTRADGPDRAWVVGMGSGGVSSGGKSDIIYYYAWPVRSGQGGGSFETSTTTSVPVATTTTTICDADCWKAAYEQSQAQLQQCQAELEACQNPTTTTAPPTNIELSVLKAIPSDEKVTLKWQTETETDNAGFNVWRADNFVKINDAVIPALGSSVEGAEYDFIDQWVLNGKRYFYLLEDIDNNGISTFHGPVKATPRWIYGAGK